MVHAMGTVAAAALLACLCAATVGGAWAQTRPSSHPSSAHAETAHTTGGGAGFMSGKVTTFTTSSSKIVSHEYSSSSGMKINEANILLPYTETNRTVQYTLTTTGNSCFHWMSTNPDCATVTGLPEGDECLSIGGLPSDYRDVHAEVSKRAAAAAAAVKSGSPGRGTPVLDDAVCTSQAVVTATSRVNDRTSAVIKARASDDYYLRCDVFVAPIARLDISTVIERIGVGTTYTVSVTAYDVHENTFSSLEGLRFQWSTSPHTEILTISKLSKSQKRVSHLREVAEREAWSDALVLHGLQTGRVNITVKLMEPGYEHLEPAVKEIKVVERPDLIPSNTVYICPAERVQYTLTRMYDFHDVPIAMPDPNFRWRTRSSEVAVVDKRMGMLTGVNKGRTEVVVSDLRLDEDMTRRTVYVVEPSQLDITLVPVTTGDDDFCPGFDSSWGLEQRASSAGNWHVVQGREYIMTVELTDENYNRMYIGENVRFEVAFEGPGVGSVLSLVDPEGDLGPLPGTDATPSTPDRAVMYGTTFHIKAQDLGEVVISATLRRVADSVTGHVWEPKNGPLTTSETAVVSSPVRLVRPPSPILLPEAYLTARHNATLVAEGGTGKYSYHKDQAAAGGANGGSDVFHVTPAGLVISGVRGAGTVVVRDLANPINCDSGSVVVVPVGALEFLPSEVEVEVGGSLRLFATARPDHPDLPRRFGSCVGLADAIQWHVHEPLVQRTPSRATAGDWDAWQGRYPDESVCASELFVGRRPGFTTVQIAYGGITATVRVSVFEPLRVVFPPPVPGCRHSTALVTLGAQAPIVLQGGPSPWALGTRVAGGRSEVADSVVVPSPSLVSVSDTRVRASTRQYAYVVTCKEHGEQELTFKVSNVATKTYIPQPVVSTVTVRFVCAPPQHAWLRLAANDTLSDGTGGGPGMCGALDGSAQAGNASAAAIPGVCDASCSGNFAASLSTFDEATLQLRGPESYVVRTNQTVPVLLDLYDGSSPPERFLNFSTVKVSWSLSDTSMATLLDPAGATEGRGSSTTAAAIINALLKDDDQDEDGVGVVCAASVLTEWPGSLSRLVKLGIKTGFVKVTATAESFIERMLKAAALAKAVFESAMAGSYFTPVSHTIRLELVDRVQLLPPYAVLFNHPQNVLRLNAVGGSGRFEYNINDTIATMAVDRSNEFVDLTPLAPGPVQVVVHDVGLETCRSSSSSVLISDANRVSLRVRDQIELGSTVPLFVDVIDAEGNYFPASQYKFMDLNFTLDQCQLRVAQKLLGDGSSDETTGASVVWDDSLSAAGGRPFDLTGLALGSARIVASVRHSGVRGSSQQFEVHAMPSGTHHDASLGAAAVQGNVAESDPVLIHVFPPLQLLPNFLSLVPNGCFVLRLEGGPRASSTVFTSSDPSVASVTAAGEVTAHTLGTVTITAQAWGMDSMTGERAVLAETYMVLTVELPKAVDIFVATSRLLVGESLKLVARSRRGQSPFSFGCANVSYSWSVDDGEVLALRPVHPLIDATGRTMGMDGEQLDDAFGAWVDCRRVGQTLVRINMHVESAAFGALFLQDTQTFTCVPKLKLLSPSWMLLPPGARARIRTNQDHGRLSYSLLKESYHAAGVVSVDGVGQVVASDAPGTSTVVVRDEHNEQWVSVKVEVKAVSHIALKPQAPYFATVPVGSTTLVRIELRDDLGRMFHLGPDVSIGIGHTIGVGSDAQPRQRNGTHDASPCTQVPASSTLDTGFGALQTFSNDAYVADVEIVHNATVAVSAKREGMAVLKIWLPYVHYGYVNEGRGTAVDAAMPHVDDMKVVQRWTQDEIIGDTGAAGELRAALTKKGTLVVPTPSPNTAAAAAAAATQAGTASGQSQHAADSPGRRLMALSDGRMLADYLALRVVNVLQPESPVTVLVGGTVQFTAFQPDASNLVSFWSAGEPEIVSIERSTGVATANRVGRGTVYFHSALPSSRGEHDTTPTHASVEVVRLESVTQRRRSASFAVTNFVVGTAAHTEPVVFDVAFIDERGRDLAVGASPHVDHAVRFECSTPDRAWATAWALGPGAMNADGAPPAWLSAALFRNGDSGEDDAPTPVCVLVPKEMDADESVAGRSVAGNTGFRLPRSPVPSQLRVHVTAQSSNGRSRVMNTEKVPFTPGFTLQPVGSATSLPFDKDGCWVLTRALKTARLNVYGDTSSSFSVVSGNTNKVVVTATPLAVRQQHSAEPSMEVDIAVAGASKRGAAQQLPASFRSVDVSFVHSLTGQKYDMCVSFDDGGGLPDAGVQQPFDGSLVVVFLALVVLLLLAVLVRVVFCGARSTASSVHGAGPTGQAERYPATPHTPRGVGTPATDAQSARSGADTPWLDATDELKTPVRFQYMRGQRDQGIRDHYASSGKRLTSRTPYY